MSIEIRVPNAGESINEVEVGKWLKAEGETVTQDEVLVELQTDKASMDFPSPVTGVISKILKRKGDVVSVGETIALIDEKDIKKNGKGQTAAAAQPKAPTPVAPVVVAPAQAIAPILEKAKMGPAARQMARQHPQEATQSVKPPSTHQPLPSLPARNTVAGREEEVVPMTPIRRRIAERLVQAKTEAALLTTFNEVDMSPVQALRAQYQKDFQEKYKVKLGLMSFFIKATIEALKKFPQINGEIRGTNIVYKNYYDIGIAVGAGRGLVVPIIRDANRLSFAELEMAIVDFGTRAKENKITIDELQGGTFSISNGGIYGSMLSTPIVNPPQSGILGLHNIQERAVVKDGQVVVRPMMYLALTYDHRIVDGREAVLFLKTIKDDVENPARILLEL